MTTETAATKPRRFAIPKAKGSEWTNYTLVLILALVQLRIGHHVLDSKGGNWVGLFALFTMLTFQRLLALDVLLHLAISSLFWIWAVPASIYLFF